MADQPLPNRDDLALESFRAGEWGPGTLAVHAGQQRYELTGVVAPPIYLTSRFAQQGIGRPRGGWEDARTGNPTRSRLEEAVAATMAQS
jgi:cystathionine gamma-synthase